MKEAEKISSPKHPPLSVAPMIDWTDRHCRYFHRLLSPNALLYTEMITTGAILNGDRERYLSFSNEEHPVALQLGGSDPSDLAECAKIGQDFGYDAINLNCGCPSDRVQKGRFGACLMAEPTLVAECVAAMREAVTIPVTVKSRIGIDNSDDYPFLEDFISTVHSAGCDTFIIHARKAWLKGLSPKENREIPPLRYDIAAKIKKNHPHLNIILNGGLTSMEQIKALLPCGRGLGECNFDGVMIGREAYQNPYFLAVLEHEYYGTPLPDRFALCDAMLDYIDARQKETGMPMHSTTRHMLGLFNGIKGAKHFRQVLSTDAHHTDAVAREIMAKALSHLR